ncbi:MAG: dipeptidase [Gammaproteobacteria bacterium]|nr:dipeptidase [Gammaproteobacteria bacterium]
MMKHWAVMALAVFFTALLVLQQNTAGDSESLIVIDTHIDVPYRLTQNFENIGRETRRGDFDYARARAGGLNAAFMSIFVPVEKQEPGLARDFADHLIDLVELAARRNADLFAIAISTKDVKRIAKSQRVALALGIENGAAIEHNLDNLQHFYERGVRYITLAHGKANQIADSSYDDDRPWEGLSPYGEEVVREMNRLGIIVDVSHITDAAVADVLAVSSVPVLASHSSARAFTPGFERNLSDDLIQDIAAAGGVIQINFGSAFLTEDANRWYVKYFEDAANFRTTHELGQYDPVPAFENQYRSANPPPFATIEDVLNHVDHIVDLVGVDHVGFGSDFDGVGDSLPEGLKSVADYPLLLEGLAARGYSDEDVRKIAGRNTLRVWRAAEQYAETRRRIARRLDQEGFGNSSQ